MGLQQDQQTVLLQQQLHQAHMVLLLLPNQLKAIMVLPPLA
jgi:hypothetical protein